MPMWTVPQREDQRFYMEPVNNPQVFALQCTSNAQYIRAACGSTMAELHEKCPGAVVRQRRSRRHTGGASLDTVTSPTSVYRYYDRFDLLIYVGVTSRGTTRNLEHARHKEWWPYVAKQTVEHFPTRDQALRLEAELIHKFCPPFNTVHNPAPTTKDGYLSWANRCDSETSFRETYCALDHKLPLYVISSRRRDNGRYTAKLVSAPEHSSVATKTVLPRHPRKREPVILRIGGKRFGYPRKLAHVGPVLWLVCDLRWGLPPDVLVHAEVNAVPTGGGVWKVFIDGLVGVVNASCAPEPRA